MIIFMSLVVSITRIDLKKICVAKKEDITFTVFCEENIADLWKICIQCNSTKQSIMPSYVA
jgi:hypothetical protein